MAVFHTGFLTADYTSSPKFPYTARQWRILLVPPPQNAPRMDAHIDGRIVAGKQIAIEAEGEEIAARAFGLIKAGFCLLGGSSEFGPPAVDEFELKDARDLRLAENRESIPHFMGTFGFPRACELAVKASRRTKHIYALTKFKVSVDLYSTHLIALDPQHTPTMPRSKNPEDHVRAAYAIIAAYSVLEEVGFGVPASAARPSCLPDGTWNPAVKRDLEIKLKAGGVDLTERFNWNIRGQRTAIEKRRPRQLFHNAAPAPWARWDVRDLFVDVVDAIGHSSWLRSNIASHKTRREVGLISAYDVANTQWLARRLLLENLGVWQRWFRDRESDD